ncbi:PREDICTED: mitochondrial inner membrane [Prunus dulcis]|uniref:PREDICTED: mitochondrial inner membrane n=1 Tax=Prunus dulcis TaxID=3755 RepID=A0A5E4FGT6_PRUDU|nr:mitochondrial inner membrane protein OXA1-like isoform X2 [Prunus dulcis]VVA27374.1 PREDICTED: mitochondrial inner membrane [Prunus dulcis]
MQIRNMAEKVPSFQSGGALWFTDLTTPHNLLILPVLTSLTFLITVECNMQEGLEGNPIAQTMKNYSRILAAISVPVMMSFPKALFCYWLTSNLLSLTYGLGECFLQITLQALFCFLSSAIEQDTTVESGPSLPTVPSKVADRRISRTSILKQRLKSLENQIKERNKQKKM